MQKTYSLKEIPLLEGLSSETLADLDKKIKYTKFSKGELVLLKGESSDSMIFVMSGELHVVDENENGQSIWLANIPAGVNSGELGLITGEKRTASLMASRHSVVGFLKKSDALSLILNNPQVAWRVMQRMADIIKNNNTQLHVMNLPSAQDRIESVLAQRTVRYKNGLVVIENLPSQQSLATMTNTSRETVSRVISKLVKDGVLEKDYKRLIVRLPERLKDLTR